MVLEAMHPLEKTEFPTIAVCEMGYTKDDYDFINDLAEEYELGALLWKINTYGLIALE